MLVMHATGILQKEKGHYILLDRVENSAKFTEYESFSHVFVKPSTIKDCVRLVVLEHFNHFISCQKT